MAKRIEWADSKTQDWKLCTVVDEQGVSRTEVSVNRKEKNGTDNSAWFDSLVPGATVEGNLWQSPTSGKWALYPPKPQGAPGVQRGGGAIKAAEITKESVAHSQDRKEEGIKISSTFRDATLLTIEEARHTGLNEEGIKIAWTKWRKWLLENYDKVDIANPF